MSLFTLTLSKFWSGLRKKILTINNRSNQFSIEIFKNRSVIVWLSIFVLTLPILVYYLQLSIFLSTQRGLADTSKRPQDLIVLVSSGENDGSYLMSLNEILVIEKTIEEQMEPKNVGWSRSLNIDLSNTTSWQNDKAVQLRQVNSDYLEILISEEPDQKQVCDICIFREANSFMLGSELVQPRLNIGDLSKVGSTKLSFAGYASDIWRDTSLTSSLIIGVDNRIISFDKKTAASWAVQFEAVPTLKQIEVLRSIVNPENPSRVSVQSAIGFGNQATELNKLYSSSNNINTKIIILASALLIFGGQYQLIKRLKSKVALVRALGATDKDLLTSAIIHGCISGCLAWLLFVLVFSFSQIFLVTFYREMYSSIHPVNLLFSFIFSIGINSAISWIIFFKQLKHEIADIFRSDQDS